MARKRASSNREVDALMNRLGTHRVDENLFLQVRKDGTRSRAFRYLRARRKRVLGLGAARKVPYAQARTIAAEYRLQLWKGEGPAEGHEIARAAVQVTAGVKTDSPSFEWCAEQHIEAHRASWKNLKHIEQWESTLKTYAGPVIGEPPVDQVTLEHVLAILKPIWPSKPETASRPRGRIEMVLGWATAKAKAYRRCWGLSTCCPMWIGAIIYLVDAPKAGHALRLKSSHLMELGQTRRKAQNFAGKAHLCVILGRCAPGLISYIAHVGYDKRSAT